MTSKTARRPARLAAERLHAAAVEASRVPGLYADLGAPDTAEGRFELLTLHVVLIISRLGADEAGKETRQALFDAYVTHLDGAMREMGVADLSMGKRMKALGEAFYGRAAAYGEALGALPQREPLVGLVARTVLHEAQAPAELLADYVVRAHRRLFERPLGELLGGTAAWPEP